MGDKVLETTRDIIIALIQEKQIGTNNINDEFDKIFKNILNNCTGNK